MTAGNYAGRVIKDGVVSMGRWSYQYLLRKNGRCIVVVISLYQACKKKTLENNKVKSLTVTAQ